MRPTSFLRSLAGLSLTAGNKQQDSTIVGYPSRGARGIFTNPNNIAGSWGAAIRQQDGPGAGVCSFHQRLIRPPRGNRLQARTFWKKSRKYREGRKKAMQPVCLRKASSREYRMRLGSRPQYQNIIPRLRFSLWIASDPCAMEAGHASLTFRPCVLFECWGEGRTLMPSEGRYAAQIQIGPVVVGRAIFGLQ